MDKPSLQPYWYQHHRYHSSISRDPPKSPYRAASHHGHGNPHYTDHSLSNSTVFFSDYPHPSSGANISSMVSSAEPRKQADYHDSPNRQALPSISEAIQGTEPAPYTFRPPSSIQTGSSLSPPFALARRSLPKTEKHPYLQQQLLPASSFPARQHALPTVSDSPRPPFTSLPSLSPVSDRRQSPSAKRGIPPQHHHPEQQKIPDPHHPLSGVYAHPPPPSPPPAPVTYQPRQLRPGRMPLPSYPTPPRYDYATPARRIAREQHGAHLIPERLPTEWEVSDMLSNMELIKRSLEHVRDLVQTSIQNEGTREGDMMNCFYKGEHHALIYGHAMQPSFSMTESKKRRARAARPGRCHGCNRTNTPEWRRGPGGARTLCNACGLHYARLERKRQLEDLSPRVLDDSPTI
ncbi:related to NsdD protein [Fusarium oxysporum]|uniref:Related to NsdD protein n=1 Tax=Fusarium oxysporum TaxID=5507 RepID=A0A2H3TJR3_FUSOX|nr:related to NsdD protein [Fusarium oxysporum]